MEGATEIDAKKGRRQTCAAASRHFLAVTFPQQRAATGSEGRRGRGEGAFIIKRSRRDSR
jgi:hypothetical protein